MKKATDLYKRRAYTIFYTCGGRKCIATAENTRYNPGAVEDLILQIKRGYETTVTGVYYGRPEFN